MIDTDIKQSSSIVVVRHLTTIFVLFTFREKKYLTYQYIK